MIYVLVGPIASGKSTYAQKMAVERGALIVNDDSIVTAIQGENTLYNKSHGLTIVDEETRKVIKVKTTAVS